MKLREGMKCNLEDLTALYADRKVAQSILDSATANDTVARIESGELNLPDGPDAKEYERQQRIKAAFGKSPLADAMTKNPAIHEYLDSLNARISALEEPSPKTHKRGDA